MLQTDAILDEAQRRKCARESFVLATVVRCESPTSAKPGAKGIITEDGELQGWIGGGCAQPAVLATAKEALADGQSRLIRVRPGKGKVIEDGIINFGMSCHSGGTLDIFIEPILAKPALAIVGISPVAQSLAVLAHHVGFAVQAVGTGADADMFPHAEQVVEGVDISQLQCGVPAYVVVATQGKRDEARLEAALRLGAPYVAFVASARKADKVREHLLERGHAPAEVEAIVAPAGVEIDAVTPEEIAVSVLADLIRARRQRTASPSPAGSDSDSGSCCAGTATDTTETASPKTEPSLSCCASQNATGSQVDPVCGMPVSMTGDPITHQYRGETYYFCCVGCEHVFTIDPEKFLAAQAVS